MQKRMPGSAFKILIMSRNQKLNQAFKKLMRGTGCNVTFAATHKAGLQKWAACKQGIALRLFRTDRNEIMLTGIFKMPQDTKRRGTK